MSGISCASASQADGEFLFEAAVHERELDEGREFLSKTKDTRKVTGYIAHTFEVLGAYGRTIINVHINSWEPMGSNI